MRVLGEVAVEYEADSAASLRANHFTPSDDAVIERSIVDVSTGDKFERAGLKVGEAALVVGQPPCMLFSKSGYWLEYKRKGLDPDASLLDEYARVVIEAKPAAAILENVHGLAYRNHNQKSFDRLIAQLNGAGYRTRARVLNAADYGIPSTAQATHHLRHSGLGATQSPVADTLRLDRDEPSSRPHEAAVHDEPGRHR